jgi:nucleotide-binding universal stress UspA family protein
MTGPPIVVGVDGSDCSLDAVRIGAAEAVLRLLAEAVEQAVKAVPEVTVSSAVVDGAAVPVLLRESRHAGLLVLGDRGLGGFTGLVVGSVAVQTVTMRAVRF